MAMGLAPNLRQAFVDISVPKWHMELSTAGPCYSEKSIILTTAAHDRCSRNETPMSHEMDHHEI